MSAKKKTGGGKRLSSKEWAKIQAEYEGGVKPKELSEKYKVPIKTIKSRSSREKWKKLTAELIREARDKVAEELKDTYTEMVKETHLRHLKTFKNTYLVAQQLLVDINDNRMAKKAKCLKDVEEAKLKGLEPPLPKLPLKEIYALNALSKAIYKMTEGERIMLGLDEFNPLEDREDPTDRLCQILEEARKEYETINKTGKASFK